MVIDRFKADLLKLASENMPVATQDGTTCYEVDTGAFYIFYKGNWYEQGSQVEPTENDTRVYTIEPKEIEEIEEPIIIQEPIEKKEEK